MSEQTLKLKKSDAHVLVPGTADGRFTLYLPKTDEPREKADRVVIGAGKHAQCFTVISQDGVNHLHKVQDQPLTAGQDRFHLQAEAVEEADKKKD